MLKYHSSVLTDIATQLKRGPVRLRLRQLMNVDFLLSVVEGQRDYPADFVWHALTGFRGRNGTNGSEARLIDGEGLRTDLVSLAEDLSEQADIPFDGWPDALFTVTDLAHRFDVSTKTIFRWRRRGLVGWKFRYPDRRLRLAFPDRCVRRFVAEHIDLVHRGSSFSQLTREERERIVSRARELVTAGERTVNAVSRTIATETNRAVETIRLILKSFDVAHPKAGVFNRTGIHVGADDQRLALWEAYVDGARVEQLAERFAKPVAWVYQTITQMRARELAARKIEFVPSPDFEAATAEQDICKAPALRHPWREENGQRERVPVDLPPYLRQLFNLPLLSAEGELALFRKLNYLKFKADRLRRAMDVETISAADLDVIEGLLADAGELKNRITQANLRLVVSIAKRHMHAGNDLFDLISDGNVSLMRAVEKFDYMRGYKFSTYGSWAIMRNFARTIPDQKFQRERYQTGRTELLDIHAERQIDEPENDYLPAVRGLLDRMLHVLDEREQCIIRQRFGLDDNGEAQTLEQIGQRMNVSKERVRQLEARAITKLRSGFDQDARQLLGT